MNKSSSLVSVGQWQAQELGQLRSPYREVVSQSWQRCSDEYHLNPSELDEAPCVGQQELQMRIQRQADVIACAQHEMDALFQQLGDEHCAVVLTDAEGVIVHMVSSPEFAAQGRPLGLRAGGSWSERAAGTNGMGTCLASLSPILVHREEHFFRRLARFTCSAVPVFDPHGTMVGALDVTSSSALIQPTLLTLLDSTVRRIEGRLIELRFKDAYPVRFHTRTECVFSHLEGRLAVSHTGRILAANRSALQHLGFRSVDELRQHYLEDLFQTTLDDMLQRSFEASFHPVLTYGAQADSRFYAVAQRPLAELGQRAGNSALGPAKGHASAEPAPDKSEADAPPTPGMEPVCFKDARLINALSTACRVIAHQTPVLLSGETGSGKEVFAKTVHQRSPYAQGPFVAINCASLPATLIEAELFGYRAGAFTGAKRGGRQGKILQANKGTLFLDEIADMPLDLQARLLRVLDERQVSPLGTDESFTVDFQLISASHQSLPQLVRQHRFREDLYYRLLGIELRLPPLRERQDRRELMFSILQSEGGSAARLSAAAEEELMRYPWPGNLRELRHVLRTAAALADGALISHEHLLHLSDRLGLRDVPVAVDRMPNGGLPGAFDAGQPMGVMDYSGRAGPAAQGSEQAPDPLERLNPLQRNERQALLKFIEEHHWKMSRVAQSLGVSRNTLYRKLHKLRIDLDVDRGA
ncbi:MAG: sigma-54-dependent Fis family transcriptional regulator [Betaproteobacteria bacterium]